MPDVCGHERDAGNGLTLRIGSMMVEAIGTVVVLVKLSRVESNRELRMSALLFDTRAFVKELTEAGMPEAQAEVLARSQATLIDEKLATKRDLKELELRLKHDLTLRLGSMMVAIWVAAVLVRLL